jgi:predicted DNA-binding transcriptional regulator AlpA
MKRRGKAKRQEADIKIISFPSGARGLLGKAQIIALLGVSLRTFQGMRSAGQYPPPDTHLGNLPRWTVETHNAWIAERCEKRKAPDQARGTVPPRPVR